jgi:hypothetical protein
MKQILNWRAAALPLLGVAFLAYSEIKKDWDADPLTKMDVNVIIAQATVAVGILFGTTTAGQTAQIAQNKVEENA